MLLLNAINAGSKIGMITQEKIILYAGQEKMVGQLVNEFYVQSVMQRKTKKEKKFE